MEERNYSVYIHINKENDKKYIGITKQEVERRWLGGCGYTGTYFGNAIKKYGWDNFNHIIIGKGLTKDEAEYFEILLIKKLDLTNRDKGYNVAYGGNSTKGFKFTKESKQKISKSLKGRKLPEEVKKKITESLIGGKNPRANKVMCENLIFSCVKECAEFYKISATAMTQWLNGKVGMPQNFIDLGLQYLEKDTIIIKQKKRKSKSKKVYCGGKIFDSGKECAEYYEINHGTMRSWLNRRTPIPEEFYNLKLHYLGEERNNNIQIEYKGENHYMYGKSLSEETKEKISKAHLGKYLGGDSPTAKKVYCGGVIFDCIKDCAEYHNVSQHALGNWLNGRNGAPQNFIDMNLHFLEGESKVFLQKKPFKKKVVCNKKIFESISQCAKLYDVNSRTMQDWLDGKYSMPQKYIDLGLRYATEEDLNTHELVS